MNFKIHAQTNSGTDRISGYALTFFGEDILSDDSSSASLTEWQDDGYACAKVELKIKGKEFCAVAKINADRHFGYKRAGGVAVGRAFFEAANQLRAYHPPYGILMGVRPVKIPLYYLKCGFNPEETCAMLEDEYLVYPEKAKILTDLAEIEYSLESTVPGTCSLYINIPFCPSRCSYCSFISKNAGNNRSVISDYLNMLTFEMAKTAQVVKESGLSVNTVYVGGGTPSILTAEEIKILLTALSDRFDLSGCKEFTFEAGRPDTVSKEKLDVLADYATKISINTQSTNDEILKAVGRCHTFEDYKKAIGLAKNYRFTINTDLIAGLPGESIDSFLQSVNDVINENPDCVTIHSLAMKRASEIASKEALWGIDRINIEEYIKKGHSLCINAGYSPYYLYRQKRSAANLENLGYAKNGKIGIYNIYMMEDMQSVFGMGAGAVTKLIPKSPEKRTLRLFGYKHPEEYLKNSCHFEDNLAKALNFIQREF